MNEDGQVPLQDVDTVRSLETTLLFWTINGKGKPR
jgi:hypothetical protein